MPPISRSFFHCNCHWFNQIVICFGHLLAIQTCVWFSNGEAIRDFVDGGLHLLESTRFMSWVINFNNKTLNGNLPKQKLVSRKRPYGRLRITGPACFWRSIQKDMVSECTHWNSWTDYLMNLEMFEKYFTGSFLNWFLKNVFFYYSISLRAFANKEFLGTKIFSFSWAELLVNFV